MEQPVGLDGLDPFLAAAAQPAQDGASLAGAFAVVTQPSAKAHLRSHQILLPLATQAAYLPSVTHRIATARNSATGSLGQDYFQAGDDGVGIDARLPRDCELSVTIE